MAKPRTPSSAAVMAAPSGDGDASKIQSNSTAAPTPPPPATLHVTPRTLTSKQVLHRVHSYQYQAGEFNPGKKGNARFSPIRDNKGKAIPTIYAAITFMLLRCGLLATIVAVFFADSMNGIPLGGDWSTWYLPATIAMVLLLIGIATFAFWRSLGGRDLLEGETP